MPGSDTPAFLNQPGRCAALLREGSALGSGAAWPAPLRAITGIMLGASEPMFVAWGPERRMVYNDAYVPLLGPRHPAALGQPMQQTWHDIWHSIGPLVERVLRGASLQREDMPLQMQLGSRVQQTHVSFGMHPLRDDDGAVAGLFCVCRETTSQIVALRQRDVAVLQASERASSERYASLLDAMGEALTMLDTDFRVLRMNREALRLDGRPAEQLLGRSHWELWPASLGTPVEAAYRLAMSSGQAQQFEQHYVSDLNDIWLDILAYPVPGGLALLYRDIGDAKRAQEALLRSKQRFQAAVRAAGVMWTNSAAGEMHGEQPGWADLTGQTAADYQGYGWTAALHPDDVEPTVQAWQAAVAAHCNFEFEHRVRHRSGHWRRYTVRAVPVHARDGTLLEWVGVHIDVTEARAAAETLRQADRRKDEFLAVLAHELRNPLAPIRSAGQVLAHPALQPADVAACSEIIDRQTRHMAWLLDDLLDVSRITAGKLELKKGYRRLRDVIGAAVETAQPLLTARRHTLTVELPEAELDVEVDDLRLAQVISNLLLNAAKYTDPGGAVRLVARCDADGLLIEVSDNGIGIAADQMEQLFRMFAQLRSAGARTQGGLGLGLALARGLVELHGGRLDARSAGPGQGATFSVRLPASVMDSALTPLDADAPTAVPPRGPLAILVADDNTDAAESLGLLLGLDEHAVHTAPDGATAFELAKRMRPQVAVLDIGMPGLNGHELARQLRLQPWGAGMLLLAVTGWGQQHDRQRALDAGFDHHFTKPVDPQSLIDCIDAWRAQRGTAG